MKHIISILFALTAFAAAANAGEERNLLQRAATPERVREVLVLDRAWVPYPDYADREGWESLFGDFRETIIRRGERFLDYEWKVVKATDYLEYERTGNRRIMEDPLGSNNEAVSALAMAELAEGRGRFIDQMVNGVLHACEMTSWALSAHLISAQHTKSAFPSYRECVLELTQGEMAQMFSWIYYFFNREFDKVNPGISPRLRYELQRRELDPYMERDDFWWMAVNAKPTTLVNNWNPWCNFNALCSFMLLEDDPDKLAAAVYRSMVSVDKFINYVHSDGACEEGPSYWGHAAGKLYDYLKLLSTATGGRIDIFSEPQIRNMGEYIVRTDVGNGYVVNFADASARGGGDISLVWRFGEATGSTMMKGYAAMKQQQSPVKAPANRTDMYRSFETLRTLPALKSETTRFTAPEYTWYPETEFCYFRNGEGLFFAAKGGYNNESHNHNDAGTFSLWFDSVPMFIDAGVGTYTKKTFSRERYTIWTMQSDYHNLPVANGASQAFGSQYRAADVKADTVRMRFSADIAQAYPAEAAVKKYVRSYSLEGRKLRITDNFAYGKALAPNVINFLTRGHIDISAAGVVTIEADGKLARLEYDSRRFVASVETVQLDDRRLSDVWGSEIYRVSLTARKKETSGTYTFTITKLN